MGQKVHPIGFRLGFNKTWRSRWYAEKEYANLLHEDMILKKDLKKRFAHASVAKVEIERAANKVKINVHTARPGIVIGKKGAGVEQLKAEVQKLSKNEVLLNIIEVKKPEANAVLIAENVASQLEKRVAFRRAMKKAVSSAMRLGALGIKIQCGGRLGGAEIARVEKSRDGRIPLQTLRADIDYAQARAETTYGTIGVKVWIFKGEIIKREEIPSADSERAVA